MTSAQAVETSVTTTDNSPSQDYTHLTPHYCLICRNCGIPDPSWSEIRHFVSFLNSQLQDCEQSFYCDMQLMRAVLAGPDVLNLEGFRSFVVRFMIQMSRVSWLFRFLLTELSYSVLLTPNNSDTGFWFISVISGASEFYYIFWWLCSSMSTWRVISFPCRILLLHLWQKRTLYFIQRTTQSSNEKRSNSFNLEGAGKAGENLTVFAIIQNFTFLWLSLPFVLWRVSLDKSTST